MQIVIPALSLHRGGGCRVLIEAANRLTARGHQVTFVLPKVSPIGWPVHSRITRVDEITAASMPAGDIILTNFWPTVQPAVDSGRGRVARLSAGFEPLWVPNKKEALATYQADIPVIAISHHLRDLIFDATGQESFIAQPGVDGSLFRPVKPEPKQGRKVLFIYRSEAHGYTYKGNDDFVEAMAIVRRLEPDVGALLVGTDQHILGTPPISLPIPFELKEAATDPEMATLYSTADVYVLASVFEALSLPPLEAMACGTPVVVTDCGGVRDYVRPGENCLIGLPRNAQMLADLILAALRVEPIRKRLIEGGRQTAALWTWDRFTDQLEAALTEIANGAVEPTSRGEQNEDHHSGARS